jgi:hypothetical protein
VSIDLQSITKNFIYIISAIFIIYGIAYMLEQIESGNPINWGVLFIFCGVGMGPPLIIYVSSVFFASESDVVAESESHQSDNENVE